MIKLNLKKHKTYVILFNEFFYNTFFVAHDTSLCGSFTVFLILCFNNFFFIEELQGQHGASYFYISTFYTWEWNIVYFRWNT